jgi:hypothetical protein
MIQMYLNIGSQSILDLFCGCIIFITVIEHYLRKKLSSPMPNGCQHAYNGASIVNRQIGVWESCATKYAAIYGQ